MKTKNEYREYLAELFLKSVEENGLHWDKGWNSLNGAPKSAITNAPYHGVNRFVLSMVTQMQGYEDNRWCTFKQIQDKGWQLEKGSKGVQIEYWLPLHPETNKPITWNDVKNLKAEKPELEIKAVPQYYYVFNGDNIKGIPPREQHINKDIKLEDIVPKIAKNMGVEIINDQDNRAFYRKSEDAVHMPKPEQFKTSYDYYATQMHELSHATGAENRLNRDLSGTFGSPSYAYEELVAEMSSCFMSEHVSYELPQNQLDNHKAYVQSWLKAVGDNPDYLIKAIKDADKCATYLEEMGELNKELQQEKAQYLQKEDSLNQKDLENKIILNNAARLGIPTVGESMKDLNLRTSNQIPRLVHDRANLQHIGKMINGVGIYQTPDQRNFVGRTLKNGGIEQIGKYDSLKSISKSFKIYAQTCKQELSQQRQQSKVMERGR